MINFQCPVCGNQISIDDDHAGKRGRCRQCQEIIRIPRPETFGEVAAEAKYHCPVCGAGITVDSAAVGEQRQCRNCKHTIRIVGDGRKAVLELIQPSEHHSGVSEAQSERRASAAVSASHRDLDRLYAILGDLERRVGKRCLKDCDGRMPWPRRGVYFFFEHGESRRDGNTPRVVRVGTHAISAGSKTTLWNRLSTHRGNQNGGGNHRGSVFRLHVGGALLRRDDSLTPKPETWGVGSSAERSIRDAESHVERAVSAHIGAMPFLYVEVDDESGPQSLRRTIEMNAIALLSGIGSPAGASDLPSDAWLGHHCPAAGVQCSGLWNVRDIDKSYAPGFLDVLEECVSGTATGETKVRDNSGSLSEGRGTAAASAAGPAASSRTAPPKVSRTRETVALVSCVKSKRTGQCPAKNLYISSLFRKSRAYAERHADRWFVLSARYGLVHPDTVVASYEETLKGKRIAVRREWARKVYEQMEKAGLLQSGTSFLWLAGMDYQRPLREMLDSFEQTDPLAGKRQGERLSWLNENTE